jgi:hypothetical protein
MGIHNKFKYIDGAVVEQVESFTFLGVHIAKDFTWSTPTHTVRKRTRQLLYPLKSLIFGMGPQILKELDSCTIGSILTGCITAWYGKCTTLIRKVLQRVVRTAQYITETEIPDIQDLYVRWCQRKGRKILQPSKS